MTSKDFKVLVTILVIGSVIFGGLLGWAHHANHVTQHDIMVGRNVADLKK